LNCTEENLMTDINITALRQHLPQYLARVARGERLRVTSRGRVVAEITPPAADEESDPAQARARLLGSVLRYDDPLDPVLDPQEWDMLR
jgi:prevent-host-death family protein